MKEKIVMAFGTFDLLHPGHLSYLKQAKKFGKKLVVVVARDVTSKKVKGYAAVQKEKTRLKMVQSLAPVTKAVLGNKGNIYAIVKEWNPFLIALGYDQKPSLTELKKQLHLHGISTKVKRMKALQPGIFKSKKLRARIKKS
jgi:FAD synthetase